MKDWVGNKKSTFATLGAAIIQNTKEKNMTFTAQIRNHLKFF